MKNLILKIVRSPALPVCLAALALFGTTVRSYPAAGASATMLDKHLWLDAFPLWNYPLWGLLARWIDGIAPQRSVALLNGFSVLCGVLTVGLTYALNHLVLKRLNPGRRSYVYALCAGSSALYLAVSTPFWLVSTRAHPLALGLLMMVASLALLMQYLIHSRRGTLFAFGVLYGLGIVEYPGFLLLAFPLSVLTLLLMWQRKHLDRGTVFAALGSVGLGLCMYGVEISQALHSPARLWMEDLSWLGMARSVFGSQWRSLLLSMPKTGWLLIFMVSVLPWCMCLVEANRRRSTLKHLPSLIFYLVMSLVVLLVLFNAPVAPWYLLGERHLVVLPYVFIAGTFGFALLYWHGAWTRAWRKWALPFPFVRNMLIGAFPACLLLVPTRSYPSVTPVTGRGIYQCAEQIVEAMGSRRWLVTDGSVDSMIRLAAHTAGRDLTLLSIPQSFSPAYRKYLGTEFDSPRLRSMARLGLLPLLREMLRVEPAVDELLAFQNTGNMWLHAGFEPVPDRLIYLGTRDAAALDADAMMERHFGFWETTAGALWQAQQSATSFAGVASRLRTQVSRVANDLGIFMQRAERDDLGQLAYKAALTVNERNASAVLNLRSLAGNEDELAELSEGMARELSRPLPQLINRHGHIRQMQELWDLREDVGEKAPVLSDEFRDQTIELAKLYQSGDVQAALDKTGEAVEENPNFRKAWYLRGLFAATLEEHEIWEECWTYMLDSQQEWPAFLLIKASKMLKKGMVNESLTMYDAAFQRSPYNLTIVKSVAMAFFQHGDPSVKLRYVTQLLSLEPNDPWGNFALGSMQFDEGELELAESSLRVAVEQLELPHGYNNLAWLLVMKGEYDEAMEWVDKALAVSTGFYPAWDTKGVLLTRLERYDEAEEALRNARKLQPEDWGIHLHLGQLMAATGRMQEARTLALWLESERESIRGFELKELNQLRASVGMALE